MFAIAESSHSLIQRFEAGTDCILRFKKVGSFDHEVLFAAMARTTQLIVVSTELKLLKLVSLVHEMNEWKIPPFKSHLLLN